MIIKNLQTSEIHEPWKCGETHSLSPISDNLNWESPHDAFESNVLCAPGSLASRSHSVKVVREFQTESAPLLGPDYKTATRS